MEPNPEVLHALIWLLPFIIILAIWEITWKLIAMWKAGRNNHLGWFIAIALINTAGILPIVYIMLNKDKAAEEIR